jgi:hypothetical protein
MELKKNRIFTIILLLAGLAGGSALINGCTKSSDAAPAGPTTTFYGAGQ